LLPILVLWACVLLSTLSAQQTNQTSATPVATAKPAVNGAPAVPRRISAGSAAARRNENVAVNRIDNDALKESNIRLGNQYSPLISPPIETSHFAAELGQASSERVVAVSAPPTPDWHGELFAFHRNSVFNARTFFQAGPVKPSRLNRYGARFTGGAGPLGIVTAAFGQNKVRGMVNGNVLVPLESERTPLAADPAVREVVSRFLAAYPDELPNRPDFDIRALNTNAPQRIDETEGTLRLDRPFGSRHRLSLSHTIGNQQVDAFQLVAGQNPDMRIRSNRARGYWHVDLSPATTVDFGAAYNRLVSSLRPEPNAVGPRVRMGYQIEELGPDSHFPIDRTQNTYRAGFVGAHQRAAHAWTFGVDLFQFQTNGIETNNQRGELGFTNNFGRTAIENLRMGTPSYYYVLLGDMNRGFRNWLGSIYIADRWRASSGLQIYYGLRYAFETTPLEMHGRNQFPYDCDCNNFSPRLGISYTRNGWTTRAGYTVSFQQIPSVTYGQVRYNRPSARYIQVQNPNLLDLLGSVNLDDPGGRWAPTFLSPDLASPYSHQYSATIEKPLANVTLRLAYTGSRTIKLLNSYVGNRAENVPGIPLTLSTVDQRRADPRYFEVTDIVNGGIAYLDAGQAGIDGRLNRGLTWSAIYTFSKAIDEGPDFTATAANRDLARGRAQSQYDSLRDKKGLSNFDSPHSVLTAFTYDVPRSPLPGWLAHDWQISGAGLVKNGTPLTLYVGSDAPGFGNVDGGPSDRPNILDPSILGRTIGHPNEAPLIISRDRFDYIRPGEVRGSVGRNSFRKARIANLNLAMSKTWRWGSRGERAVLFRTEASNLTNTPQFDEPQRNLTSPSFGRITNTLNDGRVLQFGLRFLL
jgi:hypothetical protein